MKNISFFKKKSSRSWFIQYTDELGTRKQISTRCRLKADALLFLSEHKAELSERKAKPKTLSAFMADFLLYAESQYRTGTVNLYRIALTSLMDSIGNIPMNSITPRQVDTWKASMTEKRSKRNELFSVVTVNVYFRSLKAAFNTAARWGLVSVNPFLSSKPLPTSGKKPAFLTIADFERLLSYIDDASLRDFVIFSINTGARRGEILSLKWDAVDIERRFFIIRNTDTFKTKTGKERAVPLSDAALSIIYRRKKSVMGEYVFHIDGAQLQGGTVTHAFKKAARAAGLSEGIHVHSLRHSCASFLMQAGANIAAVKELLGHSSISTTQIYLHNTTESLRHELDKIPSLK